MQIGYIVMRENVMTWAVNKVEEGGPVPMDVGGVVDEWECEGWSKKGEAEEVVAVYPNTRCYVETLVNRFQVPNRLRGY